MVKDKKIKIKIKIKIKFADETVSGLLNVPKTPIAALTLAHGAGGGMEHPFIKSLAHLLCSIPLRSILGMASILADN